MDKQSILNKVEMLEIKPEMNLVDFILFDLELIIRLVYLINHT